MNLASLVPRTASLTHSIAFDSTGRHYDMNGRFSDWWDNKTVEAFQEKADCFVQQYHNYTVPNPKGAPIHLNGKLTLGENIADAGGASAAFHAWKIREAENPGPILPGLMNFTKEQLFFISYANTWCGMVRPEEVRNRVYIDPHSPIDLRIKVSTSQSDLEMKLMSYRERWKTRVNSERPLTARSKSQLASYGSFSAPSAEALDIIGI